MHAFNAVIITIIYHVYSQDLHLTIIYCINFPICVILGCCPFWGGGSVVVVVVVVFMYLPLFVGVLCFGFCVGMHYFVSDRVLQSF